MQIEISDPSTFLAAYPSNLRKTFAKLKLVDSKLQYHTLYKFLNESIQSFFSSIAYVGLFPSEYIDDCSCLKDNCSSNKTGKAMDKQQNNTLRLAIQKGNEIKQQLLEIIIGQVMNLLFNYLQDGMDNDERNLPKNNNQLLLNTNKSDLESIDFDLKAMALSSTIRLSSVSVATFPISILAVLNVITDILYKYTLTSPYLCTSSNRNATYTGQETHPKDSGDYDYTRTPTFIYHEKKKQGGKLKIDPHRYDTHEERRIPQFWLLKLREANETVVFYLRKFEDLYKSQKSLSKTNNWKDVNRNERNRTINPDGSKYIDHLLSVLIHLQTCSGSLVKGRFGKSNFGDENMRSEKESRNYLIEILEKNPTFYGPKLSLIHI